LIQYKIYILPHAVFLNVSGYSQSGSGLGQLPPGYQPYQEPSAPLQTGYAPTYGTTTITVHPQEIIIVGACPACRVGLVLSCRYMY
jgi:hypothetical protein